MTTIDTVVDRRRPRRPGREQAAHGRRPRARRARPRPHRRPLAHRALGLPAPAHAELDDPAPRLELHRARPRRLPQRRLVRRPTSRRTPPRSARPSSTGATVHEVAPRPGDDAARRYRVVTSRGTWHARHVVIATGPHGTPYVPGRPGSGAERRPGHLERLPQPRPARRRRRARRGRLGVRACRSPTSSTAPGATSRSPSAGTPGCRGATAAWTSSGGSRTPAGWPAPSTRSPTRRPRAARDLAAARRPRRPGARHPGPRPRPPPGARRPPRRAARRRSRAARRGSATTSPPPSARADAALHRLLDSLDRFVERVGLGGQLWDAAAAPAGRRRPRARRGSTCAREGIGTVLVAAGYRPHHPWLRLPIADADGTIRQRRGVTPAEGVYVVGQRFQHRRDSGYIDGARHDARAVVAHLLVERVRCGRSAS